MATLKRMEKIVQENAFDEKKKRPGLKFNPGLALIGLRTTGPWIHASNIICRVRGGVGPLLIGERPRNAKVSQDFCP